MQALAILCRIKISSSHLGDRQMPFTVKGGETEAHPHLPRPPSLS